MTIERPRYFSGQALVADDLEQEQLYLEKRHAVTIDCFMDSVSCAAYASGRTPPPAG